MGCADSTDEKVEEKVEKTLEEQLADAEADLAAAESCRDENAENAGTVDDKKAAQEELEAKYNFWNQGNGAFWQLDIEVDKKRKPKTILKVLNDFLAGDAVDREDYQIESLVPSWNVAEPLKPGKKLKKQLKKAVGLDGTEFDAREHQPCVLFGVDADERDEDAWNSALEIDGDGWVSPKEGCFHTCEVSFEDLEDSDDDSDDSDDDNINLLIALRVPFGGDFNADVQCPFEDAQAALTAAEESHCAHSGAVEKIPQLEETIERLKAEIAERDAAAVPEPEPEPEGPTDHWFKLEFEVDKKCKPKKIVQAINMLLEAVGHPMDIEELVPLWTPTYDALDKSKKLIKQLKHSTRDCEGETEEYDARGEDPVRLIGIDKEQFDHELWNEHLGFGEEFETHDCSEIFAGLEDSDCSDSSDGNLCIQVGLRVVY